MTPSATIRAIRAATGATLAEFGAAVGVTDATVWAWIQRAKAEDAGHEPRPSIARIPAPSDERLAKARAYLAERQALLESL